MGILWMLLDVRLSARSLQTGVPHQPLADRDYHDPAHAVGPGAVPPGVFLAHQSVRWGPVDAHSAPVHRRSDGGLVLVSGTSILRGQPDDRSRLAMDAPAARCDHQSR